MADIVDPETRSRMMSGIRGKDTKPEMIIRRGLHRLGFRFRLHDKRLPGKPDLVLPKHRVAIFVHGCFWHGHDCNLFKWPKTREEFWRGKIEGNRKRDSISHAELAAIGWRIAAIWECSLKNRDSTEINYVVECLADWIINDENSNGRKFYESQ